MEEAQLVDEIRRLKQEKRVAVLAHYYTAPQVQRLADCVGDSLALAYEATRLTSEVVVVCGVHFMGETVKILAPTKKVLLPDVNASCSLAESCEYTAFKKFVEAHPHHTVVSYVNTSAAVKSLTDICCTSSNALAIVNSLPKSEKVLFAPDRNLASYIKAQTGREDMLVWDGACHVHERFSVEKIVELKGQHPNAKVLAHPECKKPVLILADEVGSTAALLKYSQLSTAKEFIVATEAGILYQMQRSSPDKTFIPVPPTDSTCGCNDCEYMKLITLQKLYLSLQHEVHEVLIEEALRKKAERSIVSMLDLSKKLGL
ncbi:MAG: quinolinate synthase NadA [Prevotellaceae bacterium]|jgi:quinolinate synthase|nr:quinolinate synthase NadA [Prevotellaceae bacterium]